MKITFGYKSFWKWECEIIVGSCKTSQFFLKEIDEIKYVGGRQKWDFFRADFWGLYHPNSIKKNFFFLEKSSLESMTKKYPIRKQRYWGLDFNCKTSTHLIKYLKAFNGNFNEIINFSKTVVHKVSEFVLISISSKYDFKPFCK
jgi:hypothetical protein